MNYSEAYDKIIAAYFKDEIQPYASKFCFCGTLANNTERWIHGYGDLNYSYKEFGKMEFALLQKLGVTDMLCNGNIGDDEEHIQIGDKEYEEALFEGMCAALEVLKSIHIERGEIIDEGLTLTKRNKNILQIV